MAYQEATDVVRSLSKTPTVDEVSNAMPTIYQFVVLIYNGTSANEDVNAARKAMFCTKGISRKKIPPTSAALVQHTKRAVYQGGHCWGRCFQLSPVLSSSSDWGWKKSPSQTEPLWTTLSEASEACQELFRCGYHPDKACGGRGKCIKSALQCTVLCKREGDCEIT